MLCAECGSKRLEKTGNARHHALEWRCQDCGHTFFWG